LSDKSGDYFRSALLPAPFDQAASTFFFLFGFTIAVLGDARVFVDSANTFPNNSFLDEVESERSRSSAMGMAGVQIQLSRAAIFAQETLIPSNSTFLFRSVLNFFEFGIRINFGSSIDRD